MDPITLILAAVIAGAAAGAKDTAASAIRDAYAGLKSLIKHRFGQDTAAQAALDAYPHAPEVWETALKARLTQAKAAEDEELIDAARRVLAEADPAGAQDGKYKVTVSGGQGVTVGDHNEITQHFGNT